MAKKKKEEGGGGGSPAWMSTFSDLMNLLLCFFVLLFSMSSVDAEKFEEVVASLTSSFSIFDGGGSSISEGNLISSGVSQLTEFDDYYTSVSIAESASIIELVNSIQSYEEYVEEQNLDNTESIAEAIEEALENSGLGEDITVEFDELYVTLTINGSLLFDSESADLTEDATEVASKLGDVLKYYDDYTIEVYGYTDNLPLTDTSVFKDNMWLSFGRAYTIVQYLVNNKGMDDENMNPIARGEKDPVASNDTAEGRSLNRRVEIRIYNAYASGLQSYEDTATSGLTGDDTDTTE